VARLAKSIRRFAAPLAFLAVAGTASPLFAGGAADDLEGDLKAFGAHAGYVAATVTHCGGNAGEIDYFKGQVRKMLDGAGGTDADFEIVARAMDKAMASAKPVGKDCTDEGGMEHAAELMRLRNQVQAAKGGSGG